MTVWGLRRAPSGFDPRRVLLGAIVFCLPLLGGCVWQAAQFWVAGEQVELRETDADERPAPADRPKLLVLAIDGIDRHLLYRLLENGELPEMAKLLGGDGQSFPHAYFHDGLLSTLPSSTAVSWATIMTGVEPAEHGVAGNEYFVRGTGEFAAPVPVTVEDATPVFEIYTDGYANDLLGAPTVYERMRERDPGVRVWVAMHQYYRGADRLILTDRTAMLDAFQSLFATHVTAPLTGAQTLSLFQELDEEIVENMDDLMESEPAADVITLYMPGLDHYAHITDAPPDESRTTYLKQGLEPLMKELRETLAETGALENRYIVLVSDHGHTGVVHDDAHSLGMDGEGEPREVLEAGGFTVRPYQMAVDDDAFFDSVLAYQGAMAYVYIADRTTCANRGGPCDWTRPARRADIDEAAELFYRNNEQGLLVPEMQGTLDMVLVRRHRADGDVFEVYRGDGDSQPVDDYLATHPHPQYVAVSERLRALTDGRYGDRAGDVILVAHNGDRGRREARYYFAPLYHSWHGSPSHRDSDIPLILAHRHKSAAELQALVDQSLDGSHASRRIADLLLRLRLGPETGPAP